MPLTSIGDVAHNYRLDGTDRRPVLVLSHGLGLDLTMWEPQLAALLSDFRVLRYDTRGHGGSPTTQGPSTIADMGRDVLALLDHAGFDRVHFCGFSMGGAVGQWLGIHAPQRLQKLVLAHTAALIGVVQAWDERIAVVNARGMKAISGPAMVRWFTPGFIAGEPAVVGALKDVFERTSPEGYVRCCAAIRDADFRDLVGSIATPTLVIAGSRDIATTLADGRFLAERIPHSQLVEIDSAHMSNVERPAEFTAALLAFLHEHHARSNARPASAAG